MGKAILTLSIFLGCFLVLSAQGVKIGNGTNTADASAILDVESSNQGLLVPRMTQAERDLIPSPATGLLIFQTDGAPGFYYYSVNCWQLIGDPPCSPPPVNIGDANYGGIIFYLADPPVDLDGDGILDDGLVCANSDLQRIPWSCHQNTFAFGVALSRHASTFGGSAVLFRVDSLNLYLVGGTTVPSSK